MTSSVIIAVGIALLVVSLAAAHSDYYLINWVTFLLGSIMVIGGAGKLLFLDV